MVKRKYQIDLGISVTESEQINEFVSGGVYPKMVKIDDYLQLIFTIFKRINKKIKRT